MDIMKLLKSVPMVRFFLSAFLLGLVATVAAYIGTSFLGLPFPPEAIFQYLISPVPGSVQSVVVETLREYAKYGTFVGASVLYAVLYALIGTVAGVIFRKDLVGRSVPVILFVASLTTLLAFGLEYGLVSRSSILSTPAGWVMLVGLLLIVNLPYGAIVASQFKAELARQAIQQKTPEPKPLAARRSFLKRIVIGAAVVAVAALVARVAPSLFSGQPVVRSDNPIPINPQPATAEAGLPAIFQDPRIQDLVGSEVTDNRVFYRVDINPVPPQLDFDKWTLNVSGKVTNPLTLTKNDLLSLPAKDQYATLECVSNTIDPPGALISNAKWTGVALRDILDKAGLTSESKYVIFRCADGYTVGVPLDRATQPGALLAYKMNDELLPNGHGSPLRAIVPGIYGMMNAKWIQSIEASDQVYIGYWQERGWSNDARIKTTSIIYYPPAHTQIGGSTPIAGVAFAGDRGIGKVEVSTDGGQTWNEATLKAPKSQYAWVLWAYEWNPSAKGNFLILTRATDGQGQLQDATPRPTFPSGASGYHSVAVTVT